MHACMYMHDAAATLVHAFVTSRLDHCYSVLVGLPLTLTACLDRVLRSAARLIGVSLNMPLSHVICVTHYIGFPFGSLSFTELLCYSVALSSRRCPSLLAGTLSPCIDPIVGRQAPRSSSGGKLLVSRVDISTMQCRAFSVVAPSIAGIHFPRRFDCYQRATRLSATSCFKLIFFTVVGLGTPLSSRGLEGAL